MMLTITQEFDANTLEYLRHLESHGVHDFPERYFGKANMRPNGTYLYTVTELAGMLLTDICCC